MMKIRAISDLHLASSANREALVELPAFNSDWLIVAGDIGEKFEHVRLAFEILTQRFAKVFWVPGNHDLWAIPEERGATPLRGVEPLRGVRGRPAGLPVGSTRLRQHGYRHGDRLRT